MEDFPIVGIGASAGGVQSFKHFVAAIPADLGMSYIFILHLPPTYRSRLVEILSKFTKLPVYRITEKCRLLRNNIYVVPENSNLEVTDHTLILKPREKGVRYMPVDVFFISLARVHRSLAVGAVLSGTDGDGTKGLWEIKRYGGTTFAEDPESAQWNGMPNSAKENGVVDFLMPPWEMPLKLQNLDSIEYWKLKDK